MEERGGSGGEGRGEEERGREGVREGGGKVHVYTNNHVHSAPQSKKEENREERKKNHTL